VNLPKAPTYFWFLVLPVCISGIIIFAPFKIETTTSVIETVCAVLQTIGVGIGVVLAYMALTSWKLEKSHDLASRLLGRTTETFDLVIEFACAEEPDEKERAEKRLRRTLKGIEMDFDAAHGLWGESVSELLAELLRLATPRNGSERMTGDYFEWLMQTVEKLMDALEKKLHR
jgi:hypothetical protein